MPRKRRSSSVEVLSHLKRCPKCKFYIGAPLMSKGKLDEANEGYYYEKCLNNREPVPASCTYFGWRRDIPRGKHGREKALCEGERCKGPGKTNGVNLECTFGVCTRCCRYTQTHLPTPISCCVRDHRKGVEYSTLEANAQSAAVSEPDSEARGRRATRKARTSSKKSKKGGADDSSGKEGSPEGSDIVEPTPDRAPPKRDTYATPTNPAYVARVRDIDTERRVVAEELATQARQAKARTHVKSATLRWWTKDGGHPDVLAIEVGNPSAFHPNDVPFLVAEYGCDEAKYEYYDPRKGLWYRGFPGSAPRDLNKIGEDELCYRTLGVTWGKGMPGAQEKRPAPEDLSGPETPRRPQSYPITPETRTRPASSPAPTPPGSGTSAWHDESGPDEWGTPTQRAGSPHRDTDVFTAVNDTFPPIPALFVTHNTTPPIGTPHVSHADTATAHIHAGQPIPDLLSTLTVVPGTSRASDAVFGAHAWPHPNISTIPRRPGLDWPFKYVVDMADGFDLIRQWEASHPGKQKPGVAFTAALGIKYISTTWNDHHRAWVAAGDSPGVREAWIKRGRSAEGEWLMFWRMWRPRKNAH